MAFKLQTKFSYLPQCTCFLLPPSHQSTLNFFAKIPSIYVLKWNKTEAMLLQWCETGDRDSSSALGSEMHIFNADAPENLTPNLWPRNVFCLQNKLVEGPEKTLVCFAVELKVYTDMESNPRVLKRCFLIRADSHCCGGLDLDTAFSITVSWCDIRRYSDTQQLFLNIWQRLRMSWLLQTNS